MAISPLDDLLSVDTLSGLIRTFVDQAENRSCSALFSRAARPLLPLVSVPPRPLAQPPRTSTTRRLAQR